MARIGKLYDETRGRLSRVLAAVRRESTGARPSKPVRIKLGQLPAPLRAVVRDESHGGILIEAELPWLTVGSDVQAEFPDGREKAGRVHWFGVDATSVGSARLRIFVDLSGAEAAAGERPVALPDLGDLEPPRRSWWAWPLATTILVLVASVVVYTLARRPPPPVLMASPIVDAAPPRVPAVATVPKEQPETPPVAAPPVAAPPAPAAPTKTTPPSPSRSRPKTKRRK
jgi:hypothetical protein